MCSRRASNGGDRHETDWSAAIGAGVAAGVVSTLVQVVVWWCVTDRFPEALFRDSRLAAAIVMGRAVLPPPPSFDAVVTLVATMVHFALSIVYGALLGFAIRRMSAARSLLAGAGFGIALYMINLHGFTAWFPWFAEVRTWDTLLAHLVFGIVAAAAYHGLAARAVRG